VWTHEASEPLPTIGFGLPYAIANDGTVALRRGLWRNGTAFLLPPLNPAIGCSARAVGSKAYVAGWCGVSSPVMWVRQ
jgi:hypothetical protein